MPKAPRVWARDDIPTPDDVTEYLGRIQAIRNAFPTLPGLPEVPPDMDHFAYQEANDIERILDRVNKAVMAIPASRVYSGEFQAGGV